MQLDLVSEVWQSLKGYVNPIDRQEAAQSMVSVLIDNGADAEEIQDAFGSDNMVRTALSVYLDDDDNDQDYQDLDSDNDEY